MAVHGVPVPALSCNAPPTLVDSDYRHHSYVFEVDLVLSYGVVDLGLRSLTAEW